MTTPVTKPNNRDEYKEILSKSIRGGSRLIGISASALKIARIDSHLVQSDVILSSPEFQLEDRIQPFNVNQKSAITTKISLFEEFYVIGP